MNYLKIALVVLFHPIKGFEALKFNRPHRNYLPGIVLILLAVFSRIFFINFTHYPMATLDSWDANIVLETALMVIPVFTWALSMYLVSAITSGEAFFHEIFNAAGYALIPLILFNLLLPIFSQLLSQEEAAFFQALQGVMWAWTLILFFFSCMTLNDYHFGKAVAVTAGSVVFMAIIWAVVLLAYALFGQIVAFVQNVYTELILMNW